MTPDIRDCDICAACEFPGGSIPELGRASGVEFTGEIETFGLASIVVCCPETDSGCIGISEAGSLVGTTDPFDWPFERLGLRGGLSWT